MFALVGVLLLTAAADTPARTLTLNEALQLAEQNNPDLSIMRERLVQAGTNVRKAWSGLLPKVSAVGSFTRNSDEAILPFADPEAGYTSVPLDSPPAPPGSLALIPNRVDEINIQPQEQFVALVEGSMPLVVMPAYYGIAAAYRATDMVQASLAYAKDELLYGVAQVFYSTVATERVADIARRQVDGNKEQERVAKARYEAGELPRVGFLRAGVERARAEQDLRRAENAVAATKLALATLLGVEEDLQVVAPETLPPPPGDEADLLETATREREDLLAARLGEELASLQGTAAWWKIAPILVLNAQYRVANFAGFTGQNDAWFVSLNAVWNLYDGGLRYAEIDEAESKQREAASQRRKTELAVRQDVKQARLDLESAEANLMKAEEQRRLADESALLVEAQFKAGAATHLDIIDASNAQFAAGIAAVSESLGVQLAALKLAKAIGKLEPPK